MGAAQGWGDFFGSLLSIFGYNPAKARGLDYTNLMGYITQALTGPEMQSQNKLDQLTKKLDSLLMMPLTGQMKNVIMKARNAIFKQKTKVSNTISKADILRSKAETLANDVANSSLGDIWSGSAEEKHGQFYKAVEDAKDVYNSLKDDIPNTGEGEQKDAKL